MRIGLAQTAPRLGDVQQNLDEVLLLLERARGLGCDLVVFPECALSGYMFQDRASATASAVAVPGPEMTRLVEACRSLQVHCVLGLLEQRDGLLWNGSRLIGPDGIVGSYDKTHIPQLGVDRFVEPGQGPYAVHDTSLGRIGLQICYDWRFPEVTRSLALQGAELVAMPTCSPSSSRELADHLPRTRAVENAIFFAMANRVGVEGPATFLGHSQVVGPGGERLVRGDESEALLVCDVDLAQARAKNRDQGDGLYRLDIMNERRPELYAP